MVAKASIIEIYARADTAISNVITREAIIAYDFSGDVLEGVDRGEKYQRGGTKESGST